MAFERNTVEFLARMPQGLSLLDPDDGPVSSLSVAPERWFGLLCAGIICTGSDLLTKLGIWLEASSRLLGEDAALTKNILLLLRGASLPAEQLQPTTIDASSLPAMRCGAAAKLLWGVLAAETTLRLQAFLTSALVSDESVARQGLFNRHVARWFADVWHTYAQSPFQFYSPSTSVPALLATLEGIEHGSATLKSVLIAAARALRQPLGEFMERVW